MKIKHALLFIDNIYFFQLSDAETHLDGGTLLISSCRTMTSIHSFSRDYYFLCLSTLSLYEQAIRIPQLKHDQDS